MQVNEALSALNANIKIEIEQQVAQAQKEICNSIRKIVFDHLKANEAMLTEKAPVAQTIAKSKEWAERFFIIHNNENERDKLNNLSQRVKNVTSGLANRVAGELMSSPMRQFFGLLSAQTSQKNLIDFFLLQTMGPAQLLNERLQNKYVDLTENKQQYVDTLIENYFL